MQFMAIYILRMKDNGYRSKKVRADGESGHLEHRTVVQSFMISTANCSVF